MPVGSSQDGNAEPRRAGGERRSSQGSVSSQERRSSLDSISEQRLAKNDDTHANDQSKPLHPLRRVTISSENIKGKGVNHFRRHSHPGHAISSSSAEPVRHVRDPENEPSTEDNDMALYLQTLTWSKIRLILSLASLYLAYGVFGAIFTLLTLPAQSAELWPENSTLWLGNCKIVIGIIQVSCPFIGLYSDSHRSQYGRRRPFLLVGGSLFVFGAGIMWLGAHFISPVAYMIGLVVTFAGIYISQTVHAAMYGDLLAPEDSAFATGLGIACQHFGSTSGFLVMSIVQPPLELKKV